MVCTSVAEFICSVYCYGQKTFSSTLLWSLDCNCKFFNSLLLIDWPSRFQSRRFCLFALQWHSHRFTTCPFYMLSGATWRLSIMCLSFILSCCYYAATSLLPAPRAVSIPHARSTIMVWQSDTLVSVTVILATRDPAAVLPVGTHGRFA